MTRRTKRHDDSVGNTDFDGNTVPAARDKELEDLFARYVEQLNRGEKLHPQEILARHPELGEELLEYLENFVAPDPASEITQPLGTLGDYKLLRRAGRGGMGVVYEAWENSIDRRVALKVLPAGIAADTRAFMRFMREAKAAGRISHPNVVPVYAMGVKDDTPYYAMEFVDGETLAQVLSWSHGAGEESEEEVLERVSRRLGTDAEDAQDEPATVASFGFPHAPDRTAAGPGGTTPFETNDVGIDYCMRLARAFAGVAEGLHQAHQKGVVHRDIKPSNLMLDESGQLRILDFGLARLEGQDSLTLSGDFMGTPLYMSPEQAMSQRIPIDHRTDIYSLGATMYEALTGHPPHQGKNYQDTLRLIVFRDAEILRKSNPRVPRDLETVVLKCLRKEPADRYTTAEALAQDLRRLARGEPIEARGQSVIEKWRRRVWRFRYRIAIAATFLALLSVLSVLGYLVLRPQEPAFRRVWEVPPGGDLTGDISPDGQFLSYVDWNDAGNLALRDLATKTSFSVTKNDDWKDGPFCGGSVFSPDSQRIVYSWCVDPPGENDENSFVELRIVDRDGANDGLLYQSPEKASAHPKDWSPDGDYILASLYAAGTLELALIPASGGDRHVIRTWTEPGKSVGVANFSRDGRYVAFTLFQFQGEGHNRGDIFSIDVDSHEETQLVGHAENDTLLGWAPDGRILFSSERTWIPSLFLLDVVNGKPQGSQQRQEPWIQRYPVGFTGDASYYYSRDKSTSDVYLAELDDAGENLLDEPVIATTKHDSFTGSGVWSSDGKQLAYLAWGRAGRSWGGSRVFSIYTVDTRTEELVTPNPGFSPDSRMFGLAWSPDGKSLLVVALGLVGGAGYRPGLYTVDVETGATTPMWVVNGKTRAVWASDGRSIFFLFFKDWPHRLVKRDLGTEEETELYRGEIGSSLAISRDGEWLASYYRGGSGWYSGGPVRPRSIVRVFPANGGEPREVTRIGTHEGNSYSNEFLSWTPDGKYLLFGKRDSELWRVDVESGEQSRIGGAIKGKLSYAAMHPDGRRIALTSGESSWELWVMQDFLP